MSFNQKPRSTCREYRVIPIVDLPKVLDENNIEIPATDQELMQLGIHVFDRGANKVQAICNGYWNRETKTGEDVNGNPWPGECLAGKSGIYRLKRQPLIEKSLTTYKSGNNGGRTRLLLTKRPEEFVREDPEMGTIPAETLSDSQRLERNLPKIMGDG